VTDQPSPQWARPFRVDLPDGTSLDGAELPSGRVITDDREIGFCTAATTIDHLLEVLPSGTLIVRPEEPTP
jgi:hypothetical protein